MSTSILRKAEKAADWISNNLSIIVERVPQHYHRGTWLLDGDTYVTHKELIEIMETSKKQSDMG